jgi:hypothetical protein
VVNDEVDGRILNDIFSHATAYYDFYHGVQVAGTLAASGLNNFGIAGMIPDEHVCLVICRIFGDYGGVREI